ncbi:MAG: TetR/AcrR family transcriptional regulator [Sporichthyaceae bacterium]
MTAAPEEAPVRAVRRPSTVVRGLLLDSARRLFAAKGYAGASTREIAIDAGVNETLIFRHFVNKEGLFTAAVVDPFRTLIDSFVDHWEETYVHNSMTVDELVEAWIHALYELLVDNRELVSALVGASAFSDETGGEAPLRFAFRRPMERMEAFTRREFTGRGLSGNPTISVRAAFGMVLSMAVFDDWFFSGVARPPSAAKIAREMTSLMVHGISGPPSS